MTDDALDTPAGSAALVGETLEGGPPPYDAAAVGEVAQRVQIETIELVGSHFERDVTSPLEVAAGDEQLPTIGMHAEWALSENRGQLGALVSFSAIFESDEEADDDVGGPYFLLARFRIVYAVTDADGELTQEQVQQFVQWNAVFNVWPYWREYLSSTMNRAELPKFVVPVMGVPR